MSRPTDQEVLDRAAVFVEASLCLAGSDRGKSKCFMHAACAMRWAIGAADADDEALIEAMFDYVPQEIRLAAINNPKE